MSNTWYRYYLAVRDAGWPDCVHPDFFSRLPAHIQQEILDQHNGSQMLWRLAPQSDVIDYFQQLRDESDHERDLVELTNVDFVPQCQKRVIYDRFEVHYDDFMECGGLEYGLNLAAVIQQRWPGRRFRRCLEWCSGGGFAGFRLLDLDVCHELHLMDAYLPSLRGCERTRENLPADLSPRVFTHHARRISDLAITDVDLVIGLPPWFSHRTFASRMFDTRRCIDRDWHTHREFFQNIAAHLTQDAVVILIEHPWGSGPEDFSAWIQQGGLDIDTCFAQEPESQLAYYLILAPRRCQH